MRWTHIAERKDCATSGVCADGEVVWSWRSNAGATVVKTLSRLAGDGGNQAMVTGESAKETVKTIARGMPVDPAEPVVTAACFFCCRRAMGEAITRHSLRPLDRGPSSNPGKSCRGNETSCPFEPPRASRSQNACKKSRDQYPHIAALTRAT